MHYESRYNPPRKAYDVYSALALVRYMKSRDGAGMTRRRMFYSDKYGIMLVSEHETWKTTLESYTTGIDFQDSDGDSDFIKTKKKNFRLEIECTGKIKDLPHIEVCVQSNLRARTCRSLAQITIPFFNLLISDF